MSSIERLEKRLSEQERYIARYEELIEQDRQQAEQTLWVLHTIRNRMARELEQAREKSDKAQPV